MAKEIILSLDDDGIAELTALADHADKLDAILAAATSAGPQVGTVALARRISEKVGLALPNVFAILGAILSFYRTQARQKVDATEVADAISAYLRATQPSSTLAPTWNSVKQSVVRALAAMSPDHPIQVASKAMQIATAKEHDLVGMRILTDVRPVFNEAADAIIQGIITHSLILDYHDGHTHRTIQFNLDATDVADLRQQCDRAERKASTLKRDLKSMAWPTTIFREKSVTDEQRQ
jgi:hypothetical protein